MLHDVVHLFTRISRWTWRNDEVKTLGREPQPQLEQVWADDRVELHRGVQIGEQLRQHLRRLHGHYLPEFEEESMCSEAEDEEQDKQIWNKIMTWFTPEAFARG